MPAACAQPASECGRFLLLRPRAGAACRLLPAPAAGELRLPRQSSNSATRLWSLTSLVHGLAASAAQFLPAVGARAALAGLLASQLRALQRHELPDEDEPWGEVRGEPLLLQALITGIHAGCAVRTRCRLRLLLPLSHPHPAASMPG